MDARESCHIFLMFAPIRLFFPFSHHLWITVYLCLCVIVKEMYLVYASNRVSSLLAIEQSSCQRLMNVVSLRAANLDKLNDTLARISTPSSLQQQ
jgi:hypothetical protein